MAMPRPEQRLGGSRYSENSVINVFVSCLVVGTPTLANEFFQLSLTIVPRTRGPAGLAVKPLDLHLVNVGSIPTGPTHGEA